MYLSKSLLLSVKSIAYFTPYTVEDDTFSKQILCCLVLFCYEHQQSFMDVLIYAYKPFYVLIHFLQWLHIQFKNTEHYQY